MLCRIYILIKQLFKKCFSAWDEHVAVKVPCHGFKYKTYTVPSNQLDSFILEKGSTFLVLKSFYLIFMELNCCSNIHWDSNQFGQTKSVVEVYL